MLTYTVDSYKRTYLPPTLWNYKIESDKNTKLTRDTCCAFVVL